MKTKSLWIYAALIALAIAASLAMVELTRRSSAARLPALPELAGQAAGVAEHLRAADRTARKHPNSADTVGKLGIAYQGDGFYDPAAACYALAAELNPKDWRWRYYLALVQYEQTKIDATCESLRQALALNPDYGPAWFLLGETELKAGRYDAAEQALNRARTADGLSGFALEEWQKPMMTPPVAIYAQTDLARIAELQGKPELALAMLEATTKSAPSFAPAQRMLSRLYQTLGRGQDSRQHALIADSLDVHVYAPPLDPLFDEVLKESHSSSFLLKHMERAIRATEGRRALFLARRAVEVDPQDVEAIRGLGLVLITVERPEEAAPYLKRYLQMAPPEAKAAVQVADILTGLGMLKEAAPYYELQLKTNPDDYETRHKLGKLYHNLGMLDQAIEQFRQVLAAKPDFAQARGSLGQALADKGDLDEAVVECLKALEALPDAGTHLVLGEILMRQQKTEEALAQFADAVQISPRLARGHKRMGDALLTLGRLDDAATHYAAALQIEPDFKQARFGLCYVLAKKGQAKEAVQQLRQGVRLSPDDPALLNSLARLLATYPQDDVRNGAEAVSFAEHACKITGFKDAVLFDTLAAAYAEAGRFDDAAAAARKGIEVSEAAGDSKTAEELHTRLQLYQARMPYREEPQ